MPSVVLLIEMLEYLASKNDSATPFDIVDDDRVSSRKHAHACQGAADHEIQAQLSAHKRSFPVALGTSGCSHAIEMDNLCPDIGAIDDHMEDDQCMGKSYSSGIVKEKKSPCPRATDHDINGMELLFWLAS